ncbi:F0F1 ATP synthase subunit B [bacterium]|jgi:F-type H+-transporting ATPase subunit b|nr:F0F1 ATP synthase subunit B [bacterium]MBT4251114.1 F0F1 ATP synthase subunit B [bacterium]MBT4598094.1 F0F1 ATP synthase subunit B [bacterium]MBT6753436.1 F0F1 ATP synthase subunit B [bacterium]MBT7038149.1 F0F1 ATP synthase subunit B [bacterium]
MEELIKTFHIDYKMLAAQMVNFAIVIAVLYKFAYKPLLVKMDERSDTIEKGLNDAREAGEKLEAAAEEREKQIQEAKKEARQIIDQAQRQSDRNKEEAVGQARIDAQKVVDQAKKQIQAQKEKMVVEIKREVGMLVTLAVKKVINEKLDSKKDEELIEKAIADVKN